MPLTIEEASEAKNQINAIGDSIAAGEGAAKVSDKIEAAKKHVDGLVEKKATKAADAK